MLAVPLQLHLHARARRDDTRSECPLHDGSSTAQAPACSCEAQRRAWAVPAPHNAHTPLHAP
eukprot:363873-Chlamydomonas_euryale.AAC.19